MPTQETEVVRGPEELGGTADPIEGLTRELLGHIGEDGAREGLVKTPARVARAWRELTEGYNQSVEEVVNGALFESDVSEMVIVRDIEFYSLCEHHLLPFYGQLDIAYIPDGKILGLSKLARVADIFARRLQVQERMTQQIAEAVMDVVQPLGVGVLARGWHLCMMMRGVAKQHSQAVTSCCLGTFRSDARTRSEFLDLTSSGS